MRQSVLSDVGRVHESTLVDSLWRASHPSAGSQLDFGLVPATSFAIDRFDALSTRFVSILGSVTPWWRA